MKNSRGAELAKNTAIITIGKISTQFLSFLLLPLYTAVLSTAEYGTVDFVTTLIQLLIPIVSLMIDQGVFRFLLTSNDDRSKKSIITGSIVFQSIMNLITLALGIVIYLINENQYIIWLLLILTATSYSNLIFQIARGVKKATDYALGSFICSSITIALNVLFIVGLKFGAVGMLAATFLGNFLATIIVFFKLKTFRYISFKNISSDILKQLLQYSFPLIPNQLSLWIMNSSDRFIVTFVLGASANGLLAISHKFPAIFMTFYNIFLLAWHETGAIHYFDEDRDEFFSNTINKLISLFSMLCIGIMLVLPICFDWLVNAVYFEAYYNIPIYMIASMCNVLIGLLGVIYVATKKTVEIAKTTVIAAVSNIIIHILLIKRINLYAASISTLVGYLIALLYRIIDAKKYIKIHYDISKYALMLLIFIISCFIYYMQNKLVAICALVLFMSFVLIVNKSMILQILARKKYYENQKSN